MQISIPKLFACLALGGVLALLSRAVLRHEAPVTAASDDATSAGVRPNAADGEASFEFDANNALCPDMEGEVNPEVFVVKEGIRVGLCCPGCADLVNNEPKKAFTKLLADRRGGEGLRAWLDAHPDVARRLGLIDEAPAAPNAARGERTPSRPGVLGNTRCPVMGEEIPEGEGETITYRGLEIRICCPSCKETFLQYPPYYLAKIEREQGITIPSLAKEER